MYLVLKAHIALARVSFNKKTTGAELDNVARSVIKKYGYDYNHGTGHGVGSVYPCTMEYSQYHQKKKSELSRKWFF